MNTVYLALGSNLNVPQRQLRNAIKTLRNSSIMHIVKAAPFYFNPAEGRKSQPYFYNTVLAIRTRHTPQFLMNYCQSIEKKQGRVRKVRWSARTLDIDIILFNTLYVNSPSLKIPHPYYLQRDFVTKPLAQVYSEKHEGTC